MDGRARPALAAGGGGGGTAGYGGPAVLQPPPPPPPPAAPAPVPAAPLAGQWDAAQPAVASLKRKEREPERLARPPGQGTSSSRTAQPAAVGAEEAEEPFDIDTYLRTESNQHHQEAEVARVLGILAAAGTANCAMELLAVPALVYTSATLPEASTLKGLWRRKSLLVHPDKCQLPDAPKAFEALKQAMADLEEEKVRSRLSELLLDARDEVYARHRIKVDPAARASVDANLAATKPALVEEIRARLQELQRETLRRAQVKYANEHVRAETNLIKAARETKERKQMDKAWAEAREARMGNWQSFLAKGKRKKSKPAAASASSSSIFKPSS